MNSQKKKKKNEDTSDVKKIQKGIHSSLKPVKVSMTFHF